MARVVPALLAGTIVCLLAGCSGGSSGSSSPGATATSTSTAPTAAGLAFSRRYGEASAMLVQCGLSHGTIKPQTGQLTATQPQPQQREDDRVVTPPKRLAAITGAQQHVSVRPADTPRQR